ncbi:homocysteine S-methyltransferase family protein [uncultured Roseovarius sp.]|uniref:homocysteine S-methyltransferase family protein n=1 Tax=uncultured Roseovarius sp. TaxID=293344 RepID=UPI00260B6657|nr:homocysteine S-methyltransferase family protein [uncultured Roseovarius sp.]
MTHRKLPHETNQLFLTDAGFETWLLFIKGFDMPCFAAYPLSRVADGRAAIEEYFKPIFDLARENNTGLVLDTNTWRANPDWGQELGHDLDHLRAVNEEAVTSAMNMRRDFGQGLNVLINGVIGPRGDGYDPKTIMSVEEAQDYHGFQVATFAKSGVDMVSALTITNIPEAIGVANAAAKAGMPCVISFTLETDGCLPTGERLGDAIAQVDARAKTKPAYFMINCAHPDHFVDIIPKDADWIKRIGGVRANASRMSHAELDCCETLDDGDPVELGEQYAALRQLLPNLKVFGGCCGTDHRHLSQICNSLAA